MKIKEKEKKEEIFFQDLKGNTNILWHQIVVKMLIDMFLSINLDDIVGNLFSTHGGITMKEKGLTKM